MADACWRTCCTNDFTSRTYRAVHVVIHVHVLHVTSSTYRAVHVVDVADVEILVRKADDPVYVLQLKQRSHYSITQTNTALQYTVVL